MATIGKNILENLTTGIRRIVSKEVADQIQEAIEKEFR